MLKTIAKLICPSSRKIAESAADRIRNGYNGVSAEKREVVAKYANVANEIGMIGLSLSGMLKDGTIDDIERDLLVNYIETLADKAKSIVFA